MERLINRRQQGDLGELSAMEWLTRQGATVFMPIGHSPDVDLIAMVERQIVRVQVKTSTCGGRTPSGHERWTVSIRTNGGNQSWSGTTKFFDPSKDDFLFVLVGDGRRWLIPSPAVESVTAISLGGGKYSEFEIESTDSILPLVFGPDWDPSRIQNPAQGEYSSGQRGGSVKAMVNPSQVRILPPPLASSRPVKPTRYERKLGQKGQAVINQKRRVTIPQRPFFEAGFANGGRVQLSCDGPGRIVIEQIELPSWARPSTSD